MANYSTELFMFVCVLLNGILLLIYYAIAGGQQQMGRVSSASRVHKNKNRSKRVQGHTFLHRNDTLCWLIAFERVCPLCKNIWTRYFRNLEFIFYVLWQDTVGKLCKEGFFEIFFSARHENAHIIGPSCAHESTKLAEETQEKNITDWNLATLLKMERVSVASNYCNTFWTRYKRVVF